MSWLGAIFEDHRSPRQKRIDKVKGWGTIIIVLALFCFAIHLLDTWIHNYFATDRVAYQKWLTTHKCQRTGFAGEQPLSVYQCDNGIWLSSEIEALTK